MGLVAPDFLNRRARGAARGLTAGEVGLVREPDAEAGEAEEHEHGRDDPQAGEGLTALDASEQHRHSRPALPRIDGEAAGDEPTQPARGAAPRRLADLAALHGGRERAQVAAGEGSLPVEGLEERDAEGELIGAGVDLGASELLRGHVRRGAHHRAYRRQGRRHGGLGAGRVLAGRRRLVSSDRAREAEVHDAHALVVAEHDVVGLEVSDRPNSVA